MTPSSAGLRTGLVTAIGSARGGVVISRLASPALREALAGFHVREAPAVAGRTVWPEPDDAWVVLEWPNWLGGLESRPESATVCVVHPGSVPPWPANAVIVDNQPAGYTTVAPSWSPEPREARSYERRSRRTRRLVSYLVQTKGVSAAWPPQSHVALVLLPVTPEAVLGHAGVPEGLLIDPLAGRPEFPGGIRLEMAGDVEPAALRSWAGQVAEAVATARESAR